MDRRKFTQGMAALSLAPLVSTPVVAGAIAPVAANANFTPFMFAQGMNYARMAGECSPEILVSQFGMTTDVAQTITSRLVRRGLLSAPNALGVSRFIEPARATATGSASTKSLRNGHAPSQEATRRVTNETLPETLNDLIEDDADATATGDEAGETMLDSDEDAVIETRDV